MDGVITAVLPHGLEEGSEWSLDGIAKGYGIVNR